MSSKKFLAFTGIRSDFDLMSYVYKELSSSQDAEFKVLAYGAHLSSRFGNSIQEIRNENLSILDELDTLNDSDTRESRILSASNLMTKAVPIISKYSPDRLIFAGDREDALVAAIIGGYLRIPTIHFFGGDHSTDGNIDNAARHAISKLSTFHFVSCDDHKQRLIKIGEPEFRIFCGGSPSLDKLRNESLIDKNELIGKVTGTSKPWPRKTALLTFHPMHGEELIAGEQIENILIELLIQGYFIFCNSPNIDAGHGKIFSIYDKFSNNADIQFFKNLPRSSFINLMRHVDLIIGNSSAGIIEAATLKKPVINVGNRQFGRLAGKNVLFCGESPKDIRAALLGAQSAEFLRKLDELINPYGDGYSVPRIVQKLLEVDFNSIIDKKEDPL
jgi:UDP-hydrolysing UDP-N-acetyl-D-glucosamine 2-epimerase